MYKIIPILLLVAVAHGQGNEDLDSELSDILGSTPGTNSVKSSTSQPPIQDKTKASTIMPPINTTSSTVAVAHGQGNEDLDSVLGDLFGPPPGTNTVPTTSQPPIQDKTKASTIVPPINTNADIPDSVLREIFGTPPSTNTVKPTTSQPLIQDKTKASTIVPPINTTSSTVAVAYGRDYNIEDIPDSVLREIFGTPPGTNTVKPTTSQPPIQDKTKASNIVPTINTSTYIPCASYLDTCCLVPDKRPLNQPVKPTPKPNQPIPDKTKASTIVTPMNTNAASEADLSCKTSDGQEGECVSYFLCSFDNNTVITDGVGMIDIRLSDAPYASHLDTGCPVSGMRPPDQPVKPTPKPDQPLREGCGWANPEGVDLQTTGEVNGKTKFGEFPWMVAILKIEPVNKNEPDGQKLNVYVGGGSLIHPSVVLTAAHHVTSASNSTCALRIRAGDWDTQSTKEIYPFQDRDVASVETHKAFNKGNLFYDIAVLFLAQPVDLAPNVGVACLPQPRMEQEEGTRCFATGWGKDKFGTGGRHQTILKKIELPVVKHDKCQTSLRKTRLSRFFQLHSSFMCAGGEAGKDTCKGDGGSPLSCPIEYETDRYVQAGIVAWGIGCGEDQIPGVYVDVSLLRDWIDDKVAGKGYDPKTYTY